MMATCREIAMYHEAMKKEGRVDIIMIVTDENRSAARKSMKECKAHFAVSLFTSEILELSGVNKLTKDGQGIFIRADDGSVVKGGLYRNIVPEWKTILQKAG